MKKNFKVIITSCVAAVGVAASIGGAVALYKSNANNAEFSIGTYTHTSTGTVNYVIGEVTNNLGTAKISPDKTNLTIYAPLGGTYSADIPAQDFVYGNLSVKATIDEALVNKVAWSVYIQGYKSDSLWGSWDGDSPLRKLTAGGDNVNLTATTTTVSKDVAVKAVANPTVCEEHIDSETQVSTWDNQWLEIYLDFNDATTASEFLNLAGKEFKIDITFGELSANAEVPLVFGDQSGWSKDALEYRMVPNIESQTWQWEFKNLTNCSKMIIYYNKMVDTTPTEYYIKSEAGEDVEIDKEQNYQVYYNGSTDNLNVLKVNTETHIIYD